MPTVAGARAQVGPLKLVGQPELEGLSEALGGHIVSAGSAIEFIQAQGDVQLG